MNEPNSSDDLLKKSLLYQEALAEQEEISRHKWLESEKQGHDIGWEQARVDWRVKHRSKWSKERRHRRSSATFEI